MQDRRHAGHAQVQKRQALELCYLPNASPIRQSCWSPAQQVPPTQASRKDGKAVGTIMANVTLQAEDA